MFFYIADFIPWCSYIEMRHELTNKKGTKRQNSTENNSVNAYGKKQLLKRDTACLEEWRNMG
jgi:hypothetical protein